MCSCAQSVIPKVFQLYPVMERFYARVAKTLKEYVDCKPIAIWWMFGSHSGWLLQPACIPAAIMV